MIAVLLHTFVSNCCALVINTLKTHAQKLTYFLIYSNAADMW